MFFIIGGYLYKLDNRSYYKPHGNDRHKGCGGRHFIIRTNDGKVIHTDSLWNCGETSEVDNAEFIKTEGLTNAKLTEMYGKVKYEEDFI